MDIELTKRFIDSFHIAKKIPAMMPDLPDHLTPRHIHIMEYVCSAPENGIRVSEIAGKMHSTMPSITRLVNELAEKGFVTKQKNQQDRRACTVHPTEAGRKLFYIYGTSYHRKLAALLSEIPEEDMRTTISVIQRTYTLMHEHPIEKDDLMEDSEVSSSQSA
ncbi:MAG: MarR family winged helix-turn-helix transcriptional regulator [Eubacterium sp.]|jgi:DNA-binding MarR family transcriptional regulator